MNKGVIKWSIGEIVKLLRERQLNEYDANIAVTGKRGDGKSTLINKILLRFAKDGFTPWKHQVYSRDDVIELLKTQMFKFCWDDEGINSGYKRNFQDKGQQELIKIITAFRDNFNIYATAIPFFYSLDKDLRELIFLHIHVIERGIAVIFMPLEHSLYQQDPWDSKNNSKLEEKWQKMKQKNPDFKFPWHKLSTFAGYLFFNDLTDKQKKLYKEIKKTKRKPAFDYGDKEKKESLNDKLYNLLMEGKLSKNGLKEICLLENKKYSAITIMLNRLLKDNGVKETLSKLLYDEKKEKEKESLKEVISLVPEV